jgi:hypothetical protein
MTKRAMPSHGKTQRFCAIKQKNIIFPLHGQHSMAGFGRMRTYNQTNFLRRKKWQE